MSFKSKSSANFLACTPFPAKTAQVKTGLDFKNVKELARLTVLHDSADGEFDEGDQVLVQESGSLWVHTKYVDHNGVEFILVPVADVKLRLHKIEQ